MNSFDLETALYKRMAALSLSDFSTLKPDEELDPKGLGNATGWRRGVVISPVPKTVGFGNGVYTRADGIYQIDLYYPRDADSAFERLKIVSDAHVTQFFPSSGRGLTVTQNSTSAHIIRRPSQRYLGREGTYLREFVEIDFYVEIPAAA